MAKPHGVAGEVLIRLTPELVGTEPNPSWLFVDVLGGLVPFEVNSIRPRGDDSILLGLDTITNDEKARRFQGAEVYIDPLELGENNQTNLNPNVLIGFNVMDSHYGPIGVISAIHEIKQNPLVEIEFRGKSILIPLQEDFIISMDKETRVLLVKTPEGLIDLYLE